MNTTRKERIMNRPICSATQSTLVALAQAAVIPAGVLVLAIVPAASANADARASTGTFTFTDHFVIEPGDPASCSFPITADQVGRGTFQVLSDANGTPTRFVVHNTWVGTLKANGKTDVEHAAQTNTFDLVDGTSTQVGMIHDLSFGQGVVIHDVGLLRFNPDGSLTFEAGPHQGFDGDPAAIASLCDSLS
jgi:hypothetical protein